MGGEVFEVGSKPCVDFELAQIELESAQLIPSDVTCPVRHLYAFSSLPLNKFQSPEYMM